jgi:hypothetical protein
LRVGNAAFRFAFSHLTGLAHGRCRQGAAGILIERAHEFAQQAQQGLALIHRENFQRARLGTLHGRTHFGEYRPPPWRDFKHLAPTVMRIRPAHDKSVPLELLQHHCGGRTIKAYQLGQTDLIQLRKSVENVQRAALRAGNAQRLAFLPKQGAGDLVRPPDQKARALIEHP